MGNLEGKGWKPYERRVPWDDLFKLEDERADKRAECRIDFESAKQKFEDLPRALELQILEEFGLTWDSIVKYWIAPGWEEMFIEDNDWNKVNMNCEYLADLFSRKVSPSKR